MPGQVLTPLGGTGLRREATGTGSQAFTATAREGAHWGGASFCLPWASGPQFHRRAEGTAGGSLKTGRPLEKDPRERVSHLSSSLGKSRG